MQKVAFLVYFGVSNTKKPRKKTFFINLITLRELLTTSLKISSFFFYYPRFSVLFFEKVFLRKHCMHASLKCVLCF